MKYKLFALGVVAVICGYLGYRAVQHTPALTTYIPVYAPIGDASRLATYENSDQLFYLYYPSNWVLHNLSKPFLTAGVERISFTTSANPANENDPVLTVYSEGGFGEHSKAKTVEDWVNSNEISNYMEVKNVGAIQIGSESYTHFEIRGTYPGTPDEPHLDLYAQIRKRYPAQPEVENISADFIGFGIPSDSLYKKEAMNVIEDYHSWGVFDKR